MNQGEEQAPAAPTSFAGRGRLRLLAGLRRLWRSEIVAHTDQVAVLQKVASETDASGRYLFLSLMSAGIAVLGLLQSSPAVVIGAMLLSPLMSPIIGAGLALAVGDVRWLRQCARTLWLGLLVALLFSAFIVALSPIQTVTEEIAARTRPNLFDLLVALFSGLAGAYAIIRGREGTIVGVAIATALMPPIAVVGFGLATLDRTVFAGALLLFITNLMVIALSAAVMARFYGFSTQLTKKQSRLQVIAILGAFLLLAVPLGYSLSQIALELRASVEARAQLVRAFPARSRLSQVDVDFNADPISITASVLTPTLNAEAERQVAAGLERSLERRVAVHIDQFRVGTDPAAAEQAALAAARSAEVTDAQKREQTRLVDRVALISGADPNEIIVDRERKIIVARARPIPGAGLATYRELERRVAEEAPRWSVRLRPPVVPLPDVRLLDDGQPDPASVGLIAWAAKRIGAPVQLTGDEETVQQVRAQLEEQGITDVEASARNFDGVRARWVAGDRARD